MERAMMTDHVAVAVAAVAVVVAAAAAAAAAAAVSDKIPASGKHTARRTHAHAARERPPLALPGQLQSHAALNT